jgi:hypothetical protein
MRKACLMFVPLVVLLLASASGAEECLICHSAMSGKVKTERGDVINVHVNAADFEASVHGSFECTDCHVNFLPGAHMQPTGKLDGQVAALVPFTSKKSKSAPAALAACVKCHEPVYADLKKSVHGENIFVKKESDAPLCLDCHGNPHYIMARTDPKSRVNHANVLETCGRCHENEEVIAKYKLGPYVIEKYKESFHGKKYILGHKRVPICNDCHGGHLITKVNAPDSPVQGEGKVRTCGKCHHGATARFAAAPAHKYIGAENPIPYYGEKALIVLLLGVFMFIVSHVVLESVAEIRDRVFRKEDHHDD